ncbi:unnamed protein product, partial [Cladocopium goreaui]
MESRLRQPGWARPLAQQRHASREGRDGSDGRVASLPPLRDRSRPGSQEPLAPAPRSRSRAADGSPWQEKAGSGSRTTSATRAAERWPANHPFQEEVSPPKPGRPPRASPAPRERRDERREERREEAEGRRSAGSAGAMEPMAPSGPSDERRHRVGSKRCASPPAMRAASPPIRASGRYKVPEKQVENFEVAPPKARETRATRQTASSRRREVAREVSPPIQASGGYSMHSEVGRAASPPIQASGGYSMHSE